MKKLIKNSYANFYLNAAVKLNLEYEIHNSEVGLVEVFDSKKRLKISANVPDLNSQLSGGLAANKKKTSVLLQKKKIPVPEFKTFTNSKSALKYALQQNKNNNLIVVKPLSGSLSIGVTVGPRTLTQICRSIKEAFAGNTEIIIEKDIEGQHYRITVLDDEIIAITKRIPAFVIGNGKYTIQKLINNKNIIRKKQKLPLIILRKKDLDYLGENNVMLDSIYPRNKKIQLQYGCDLDIGGEREKVNIYDVPKINQDMFILARQSLYLHFAGIDFISPDIKIPYTELICAINEINSAPDLDVHFRDSNPYNNYAAEKIMSKIFKPEIEEEKFTPSILFNPKYKKAFVVEN